MSGDQLEINTLHTCTVTGVTNSLKGVWYQFRN